MAEKALARLRVMEIKQYPTVPGKHSEVVHLDAVYSDKPDDPNHGFSEATPHASLDMTISNEAAQGFFRPGVEYDVAFTPKADG